MGEKKPYKLKHGKVCLKWTRQKNLVVPTKIFMELDFRRIGTKKFQLGKNMRLRLNLLISKLNYPPYCQILRT